MAEIEGEILIGRSVEDVFDFVADQRNEPQYNPRMVRAAKVTDGPVGTGTVFRRLVAQAGPQPELGGRHRTYSAKKARIRCQESEAATGS
jgi:hypothetical protein